MTLISTPLFVFAIAFLVIAGVAALVSLAAIGEFIVTNRKARLARNESVRGYYGGFALSN